MLGSAEATRGYLFAEQGVLVRVVNVDHLELVDAASEARIEARGIFGRALLEMMNGAGEPPLLAALGHDTPLGRILTRLRQARPVPLGATAVLELGGFDILFIELVGRCNERCVHCYAGSGPSVKAALTRSQCDDLIDDAATLGFSRVQLTGGDPLLCAFLPRLATRAHAAGLKVEIYTNGLALSERLLDALAPASPSFAFSFYCDDAATHDAITRTPGSHGRTSDAVARTLARGYAVRAAVVAMAANANRVDATTDYLRQLGVRRVSVTGTFAVGRGERHDTEHQGFAHTGSGGGEPIKRGRLCVTYDGDVVPCIFNRKRVLGRITERRLRDIVTAPNLTAVSLHSLRDQLSCTSCRLTSLALDALPR